MRKKLYCVIDVAEEDNKLSKAYDSSMIVIILLSILPLAFKNENPVLAFIDSFTVWIFIVDYLIRFITADFKFPEKTRIKAFLCYPFSLFAIIDLLSILPSLTLLNDTFRILRIFRLIRTLRLLRIFKFFRYSKSLDILLNVLRKQKDSLTVVTGLTFAYIVIAALVVFNAEPETFATFFDALYWSTTSLTTVAFGDIYPVTTIGRTISMVSSIIGVVIIALPSSIITAGYMEEVEQRKDID